MLNLKMLILKNVLQSTDDNSHNYIFAVLNWPSAKDELLELH